MANIKDQYQSKLERVAIANYAEVRENELAGKRFTWADPRNESIETGLNQSIALYNELKSLGKL